MKKQLKRMKFTVRMALPMVVLLIVAATLDSSLAHRFPYLWWALLGLSGVASVCNVIMYYTRSLVIWIDDYVPVYGPDGTAEDEDE